MTHEYAEKTLQIYPKRDFENNDYMHFQKCACTTGRQKNVLTKLILKTVATITQADTILAATHLPTASKSKQQKVLTEGPDFRDQFKHLQRLRVATPA